MVLGESLVGLSMDPLPFTRVTYPVGWVAVVGSVPGLRAGAGACTVL